MLKGYTQSPIEGQSFAATLTDPTAPGKETQFYAMLGQRSLYHEGWLACALHPPISGWGNFGHDVWELYHLAEDRAQLHNLADTEPQRLAEMKELWFYYAGIFNGLPLDDRNALEQVLADRPHPGKPRDHYIYYPNCADVPESAGAEITGRSYTIAAGVHVDSPDAEGVLFAHGGVAGGHSLYVKDHRLRYTFNWLGTRIEDVAADRDLTPGGHVCTAEFTVKGKNDDPAMPGFAGTLDLYLDDQQVASSEIVTQPGVFCLVGGRYLRRTRQRLPGHRRLHRTVPVHRRHHRQGRRRRLRRTIRRPRGTGPRLVHDRLTAITRLSIDHDRPGRRRTTGSDSGRVRILFLRRPSPPIVGRGGVTLDPRRRSLRPRQISTTTAMSACNVAVAIEPNAGLEKTPGLELAADASVPEGAIGGHQQPGAEKISPAATAWPPRCGRSRPRGAPVPGIPPSALDCRGSHRRVLVRTRKDCEGPETDSRVSLALFRTRWRR